MRPHSGLRPGWLHIKPRLSRRGVVANPRDTTGYRCGSRLATPRNASPLFVQPSWAQTAGLALLVVCGLAACAGKRVGTPDNEPTIKALAGRTVVVEKDQGIAANEEKAIEAYRKFLEVAPRAPQRSEAMRRLGDLEMDSADSRSARSEAANADPDYRAAIGRYEDYLKNFPNDPGNDRVLYQLARAYEQGGRLETALQTLDRLVHEFPNTAYRDEAHFRRGELLFTTRNYVKAEQAYATVLQGSTDGTYHDRALYMHGWSLFKQGRPRRCAALVLRRARSESGGPRG